MRFLNSLAMLAVLAAPTLAMADTIGNPAVGTGTFDGNGSDTYILSPVFACVGCQVTSYEFYGEKTGNITPVLFTAVTSGGTTTFTVIGIGTTRNATTVGVNDYSFGLTSGTDVTTAATYFGFFNSGTSNVAFLNGDSSTGGAYLLGTNVITLGGTYAEGNVMTHNAENVLNDRTYSINATATEIVVVPTGPSAVPEPSSIALLGTGLFSVAGFARRKFRS